MLPGFLPHRARLTPHRLALVADGQRLTFAELNARADARAHQLAQAGVQAGAVVAVLARNGAPLVIALHALSRLGAILLPLNTRLTPAEWRWQLRDAGAKHLLTDAAHEFDDVQTLPLESEAEAPAAVLRAAVNLADTHSVLYTSGTTGQPKGAVLTYGNHWWNAIGSALNLGLHDDDVWLACLPLFHVGGLAIVLRSVIYGIPAIVQDGFDPAAVNRAIDAERVTIISVVSAMLQRMLDERGAHPYPASLRCVLLGGGPAPRPLLEACAQRGLPVMQTYGLTEAASQVATLAPADALRKLGSAGKPLFPVEIKIDVEGRAALAHEPGEIVVRGPTLSPGYWHQPPFAEELRTGDIGYLDDEGYLYVLDRRDDLIISGGENIYPAEVEATLLAHPAIAEAGVIGQSDARWGQVPVAFIVTRAPVAESAVRAFCSEHLARYKIPAHFYFVDSLPRNAAGKLLRRALKQTSATQAHEG